MENSMVYFLILSVIVTGVLCYAVALREVLDQESRMVFKAACKEVLNHVKSAEIFSKVFLAMKIKVFYDDPSAKMFFVKAKPGWCYARVNWKGEIFFSKSRMDVLAMYRGLARHELEHIYQMRRHTRIGYHLFYCVDFAYRLLKHWNLETAYRNVWYERQAVAAERHPLTFVEEMILLKGVED